MIDSGSTFLILRKWADDESLLVCQGTFRDASFALTGTISALSEELCTIDSANGEAKLCFHPKDSEASIEYVERRAVLESDVPENFAELGRLTIFLPPRFSLEEFKTEVIGDRDTLTISELHPSELRGSD